MPKAKAQATEAAAIEAIEATPQASEDKLFSDAGKITFPYQTWETIGDKVKGVYVGKYKSTSKKYGYEQENYILQQEDGSKVVVSGRNADRATQVKVIYGMDKIPFGAVIGFIFTELRETNKGNPAKIIEIRYLGEQRKDIAEAFKAMFNVEEIAKAENESEPAEEPVSEEPEM